MPDLDTFQSVTEVFLNSKINAFFLFQQPSPYRQYRLKKIPWPITQVGIGLIS